MQTEIQIRASNNPDSKSAKSREENRREKQRQQSDPKKVQRQKLMKSIVRTEAAKNSPAKIKISAPVVATDYMTTMEAAAYLKLSRQFLETARYRGDGSGPPYIKLERAVRYRRSVLDKWMSEHDHSPDTPSLSK